MPKTLTPQKVSTIVQLYEQEQLSIKEVADRTNVSVATVRAWLVRKGISIRSAHRNTSLTLDQCRAIADLYADYVPNAEILESLGIPGPTPRVYAALKRVGVSPRLSVGRSAAVGESYIDGAGYVVECVESDWKFFKDMHGAGGNGRWIRQHRKVMAETLDRPLLPAEQVHHLNGDKTDNRPENLFLTRSHGSGQRYRCAQCHSEDLEALPPSHQGAP